MFAIACSSNDLLVDKSLHPDIQRHKHAFWPRFVSFLFELVAAALHLVESNSVTDDLRERRSEDGASRRVIKQLSI